MESIILKNKTKYTKASGEEIVDLASTSINYTDRQVDILDSFYITKDMEMRPDLVSYLAYGTTDYYDLILKFNNISNPFSLKQGDYIFIPEITYMSEQLNNQKQINLKSSIINQYIDLNKKIEPDQKRLDYISKIKSLTKNVPSNRISKYNLSPNLAEPGKTESTIDSITGRISLGESE